ncbi:uncharacterized protein K460DRAFT_371687 [Cucurbitaria berberidis CBS 394.84]|uniref:Uncharacterized protein n=1 Tax=Cucurbitaria berberidis CBS 394.84 TaxID=1168544 RepID=A0A9P4G7J5_9PLEO|nr:uncharacterized protein K460DRAFT_371687 [Cucurbitaria berberidis CBS 394.84]KAF1840498.1 hypothetical protein K460DRAFT_371687 [Cucurbitaria berberidis CBS 394.84]
MPFMQWFHKTIVDSSPVAATFPFTRRVRACLYDAAQLPLPRWGLTACRCILHLHPHHLHTTHTHTLSLSLKESKPRTSPVPNPTQHSPFSAHLSKYEHFSGSTGNLSRPTACSAAET